MPPWSVLLNEGLALTQAEQRYLLYVIHFATKNGTEELATKVGNQMFQQQRPSPFEGGQRQFSLRTHPKSRTADPTPLLCGQRITEAERIVLVDLIPDCQD